METQTREPPDSKIALAVLPSMAREEFDALWSELREEFRDKITEFYCFQFGQEETSSATPGTSPHKTTDRANYYLNPKAFGYGGDFKILLRHAVEKEYSQLIVCHPRLLTARNLRQILSALPREPEPCVLLCSENRGSPWSGRHAARAPTSILN
ncbi:MAG: hypothetical protein ACYTDY_14575, partial [Planctomycetota bacterium]